MENKYHYIELEELIGRPPKLYIRIGGISLLIIIALLLLLSIIISLPSKKQIPIKIGIRDKGEYIIKPVHEELLYLTKERMLRRGDTIAIFASKAGSRVLLSPYDCNIYPMERNYSDTLTYYVPMKYQYFLQAKADISETKNVLKKTFFEIEIEDNLYTGISGVIFRPERGGNRVLIEAILPDSINEDIYRKYPIIQNLKGNITLSKQDKSVFQAVLGVDI